MVVAFQPHRYTRTRALMDEFSRAFYQSDVLVILPIYAASEEPLEGVTGQALGRQIAAHGHKQVVFADGIADAAEQLKALLAPGDLLLTLGAGDVWKIGAELLRSAWTVSESLAESRFS